MRASGRLHFNKPPADRLPHVIKAMPPNEAFRSQPLINRRNELQVLQLLATVKMMAYRQQTNEYNTKQKQVKTFTSLHRSYNTLHKCISCVIIDGHFMEY